MAVAERARAVLAVVEDAVGQIKVDRPMGNHWVILWTASVVLLCTVGEALGKDRKLSPGLNAAIRLAQWRSRARPTLGAVQQPSDQVYWGFIQQARNSILHEFELRAGQGVIVGGGSGHRVIYELHGDDYPELVGLNQVELLERACAWWHQQLDGIEECAAAVETRPCSSKRQLP